ncbi:hypothetical protein EV560_103365 [Bosea sp. BK604]|nr:hypothetical protein EV560_103365 [Bosea sp. BK604]
MCPKPLDIYMSNDPGPGCERIVPTRLSEFIETFEASVETLVILPDLVLHVTD